MSRNRTNHNSGQNSGPKSGPTSGAKSGPKSGARSNQRSSPKSGQVNTGRNTHENGRSAAPSKPQRGAKSEVRSSRPGSGRSRRKDSNQTHYLYGLHTVRAAFENERRTIKSMLATQNAWDRLDIGEASTIGFPVEFKSPRDLDNLLGKDAIHQGIVAEVYPLKPRRLEELTDTNLVVILDQVTDPHNVGAIMRSAVALGAGVLITTARNSPQETGVLAKSASGALEMIDHIEVKNLGEAIDELHFLGFQTLGLDSEGPETLEDTFSSDMIAIVLGAEGKGLRHKTRAIVSNLARIDMPGPIKSLNVSNAATLSLYAAHRHLTA